MRRTNPGRSTTAVTLALLAGAIAGPGRVSEATAQAPTAPPGDRVHTVGDTLVGAVGGVAVDALGYIYSADFRETVYKIAPDGRAEVFATGLYGASGNAIDGAGNLYQSSFNGHHVTKIDRHGNQEIVAEGLSGPVGIAVGPNARRSSSATASRTRSRGPCRTAK